MAVDQAKFSPCIQRRNSSELNNSKTAASKTMIARETKSWMAA